MARNCICCGKPYEGRIDKKFCCDDCRTDYHNQIRRERDRRFRTVNHILASHGAGIRHPPPGPGPSYLLVLRLCVPGVTLRHGAYLGRRLPK